MQINPQTMVYPPPKPKTRFCIACFRQGADITQIPVPAAVTDFSLHDALKPFVQQIATQRTLCSRCNGAIRSGNERALRLTLGAELIASGMEPTLRVTAFLESDIGVTVALWFLAGQPPGTFTPGIATWCAILDRFPKHPTLPSVGERDLGNSVYGAFATFVGGLWIENLVSTERRKGYARKALRDVCDIADEYGATITGAVKPNMPPGYSQGATETSLLDWYATEGFLKLPFVGVPIIARMPQ